MLSPAARRAALAELEDLASLQLLRLKADLARRTNNALDRQARARKARLQAIADYALEQEPLHFASAMGPRARMLSQLEGDESC